MRHIYTLIIYSFIFLIFIKFSYAQNTPDSVVHANPNDIHYIFRLDNRLTRVHGNVAKIYGLATGISLHEDLRFKLVVSYMPAAGLTKIGDLRSISSQLWFISIGNEYDFIESRWLNCISYFLVGFGRHWYASRPIERKILAKESVLPLETGMYFSAHLFPWLDAKFGGGWRWVFLNPKEDLGNYYLKFGFGIHPKAFEITKSH